MEEYKLSNRQKKAIPSPRIFELQPGERMAYSWCMPVAHEKRLKLNIYGKTSSVNFQAIGTQVPIRYKVCTLTCLRNRGLLLTLYVIVETAASTNWSIYWTWHYVIGYRGSRLCIAIATH